MVKLHLTLPAGIYCAILSALVLSVSMMFPIVLAQTNNNGHSFLAPGSKPFGKTYGEWSAAFWQWIISAPSDKNPSNVNDNTGKYCSKGQSGPVWFLPLVFSGDAVKTCNIPSGKTILFPVVVGECSTAEYPQYKTESELRKCAKDQADKDTSMDATIDGKKISDLQKYRTQSPLFQVNFPNNNVFSAAAGPSNAVADGVLLLVSSLPPGKHQLQVSTRTVDFTSSATVTDAGTTTYNLDVMK